VSDPAVVLAALGLPVMPDPLPLPVPDSHTHLTSTAEYSGLQVADSLAAADLVGVQRFVDVGTDVESSRRAVELAAADPRLVAAVAIHPNDAARMPDGATVALAQIDELAGSGPHVRAVGETGLDHYRTRDSDGQELQRRSFAAHIEIATARDLTLVIHDRDAHADVLQVLDQVGVPDRVVMHCFSGDADFARECLHRGAWLSYPGVVTFKNAEPLREALRITPLKRLLVETDAPYLTPVPARGKPNAPYLMPNTVRFIADQLAAAGRIGSLEELCEQLDRNTDEAFGGRWGGHD